MNQIMTAGIGAVFGAAIAAGASLAVGGGQKLPADVGLQVGALVAVNEWEFDDDRLGGNCSVDGTFTYAVTTEQPATGIVSGIIKLNAEDDGGWSDGYVIDGKGQVRVSAYLYSKDACNYDSSSKVKIESIPYLAFQPSAITTTPAK